MHVVGRMVHDKGTIILKTFFTTWQNFRLAQIESFTVLKKKKYAFGMVENILEKGEITGYNYFLVSQLNSKRFFSRVVRSQDCVGKG